MRRSEIAVEADDLRQDFAIKRFGYCQMITFGNAPSTRRNNV